MATLRELLVNAGNESLLTKLDSAIFLLCLDDTILNTLDADSREMKQYCKNMLHGNGLNRWFDKSFSLIVDKGGRAGVNFEHAWGDGVAVLRFVNEVHKDVNSHNFVLAAGLSSKSFDPASHVHRLDFKLTDTIKHEIAKVRKTFEASTGRLDLSILQYHGFGKEAIKKYNFYPDGIMQLAFQMAYFRLTGGQTAATYESCSTAAFKHGRTECIRPATTLTKEFCEKVCNDGNGSPAEMRALLKATCAYHGQLTKEAAMGNGFDRHLFALRKLAESQGKTLPIFTDSAYVKINHNIMSTSTLQSPAIAAGGFAPVVDDGYGIGYSSMDHSMGCVVFHYPTRSGTDFTVALKQSFDDILKVING
ncbi:Carnitine O-palmitoyltransferase 2, mitochondrial [Hypsibius exemplaris]|uniref:Carnitine O-palmitoyltransferase 2, mitochondrial n=1 Tax=Hypsibius exemplaris TaxID=2072580 RepID=A0A1W0X2Y8_HYPEX|nr:Carnitine O-palmitoyltransferase 2, mitochondrial [Hypsibius exemplaris]